jgi:hypothetical protein
MKQYSEKKKDRGLNDIMKYLGILMALLYVALGVIIVSGPSTYFDIPVTYALPLGSMLIVYGLFRAYRIYQKSVKG